MTEFRRGSAEIQKANEAAKAGQKDFKPFLPSIFWKDDGDVRYILILNPVEDIPLVQYHPFIELADGGFDQVIARTEPAIGERVDPIEKAWKYPPKPTNLAIAVELEPVLELDSDGYNRPRGFSVKTVEFERRIRDDEGELTDEKEEVTAPAIGVIAQSPNNFFNQISAFDATEAPVHKTALKITRIGTQTNTTYQVTGYVGQEIDLTNLFEGLEYVSYAEDTGVLDVVASEEDDTEAGIAIGEALLNKRLDELSDIDHYNDVLAGIDSIWRYAKKDSKKDSKSEKSERPARPTRSQRKAKDEPDPEPSAPAAKATARRRKPTDAVSKASSVDERLAKLREQPQELATAAA